MGEGEGVQIFEKPNKYIAGRTTIARNPHRSTIIVARGCPLESVEDNSYTDLYRYNTSIKTRVIHVGNVNGRAEQSARDFQIHVIWRG